MADSGPWARGDGPTALMRPPAALVSCGAAGTAGAAVALLTLGRRPGRGRGSRAATRRGASRELNRTTTEVRAGCRNGPSRRGGGGRRDDPGGGSPGQPGDSGGRGGRRAGGHAGRPVPRGVVPGRPVLPGRGLVHPLGRSQAPAGRNLGRLGVAYHVPARA